MTTVLLAGGGTGGHVFPLVAVAEALRRRRPGVRVVFVGTSRGIETRVLPARGERLELLDVLPIKGGGLRGAVRGVAKAAASLPAARKLVREVDPDVVLTVGGYAAGPVSLAAYTLGIPVALLEPNRILGLANHVMTPLVERAYVAYPEVEKRFRPSVVRRFGVPLRPGFEASAYETVVGRARVVVLGGSQGAAALNRVMPAVMARVRSEIADATVVHQAGRGNDGAVRAAYEDAGVGAAAEVVAFVNDVPTLLASADVVVARAGAGAVAEICAVGRAAIFVPFPFAADDHQRKNAESLANAGAARCVAQDEASAERLAGEIGALLRSPTARRAMADRARERGVPGAADLVAADLLALRLRAASRAGQQTLATGAE